MYKNINVKVLLQLHNTINFCLDCLFILLFRNPGKRKRKSMSMNSEKNLSSYAELFANKVHIEEIISPLKVKEMQGVSKNLAHLDLLLALHLTANPANLRGLWEGPNCGGGENRQVQMLLLLLQASSHRSSSAMV
jgi:hypothetical protein